MRILNCKNTFDAHVEPGDSQELRNIATQLMPEFLHLFAQKNKDYGNNAQELGLRGQFADIWRKIAKLKKSMWDGEELLFEGTDEVIMDLIGHLFLSLNMLRVKEEAERVYAYNEDDAAVDAFFRMVGGDPRAALAVASVLHPPFRELVSNRAKEMMAADAAEATEAFKLKIVREAQGLIPAGISVAGLGRATDEAVAAESAQTEARYEAYDEPLAGASEGDVVAGLLGMAFEPVPDTSDFVGKVAHAAKRFRQPVPFGSLSTDERRTAVDGALDRLKVGRSTFEAVATGVNKTEMSLAEWLYRRHGQGVKEWADLEPHFKKLWEIEADAAIQIARRG